MGLVHMSIIVDNYMGNPNIKRDGVVQQYSAEQVLEYAKCANDPIYFAESYCKVINLDDGLVPFKMYPYQKKMFHHFQKNRFSIILACRQSGKSISSVMYLLWYTLFHADKTVAILANKGSTAKEMLSRIALALENIPFFLQPGCKAFNKGNIDFSNNSKIFAASTSSNSVRGFSANLVYLDEFAFVDRAAEFYTSTYPIISSGKTTQVIITSTANGIGNQYHKIWEGALQRTNEYKPFRVDWWDVPGRDEAWKEQTIANTSQIQFDQEYGNTFYGTGDTLINSNTLMALRAKNPLYVDGNVKVYEKPQLGREYVMCADVCRGLGQDYSTFNIIDVTEKPFKQVAVYRDNKISPLLFSDEIYKWAVPYNEAYVIIESNDQGPIVCNALYHELEYENMHIESAIRGKLGLEITKKSKRLGCAGFKDILESSGLEIVDEETIKEISTFEAKGNSWEASNGNHDDLVMNLILLGYFANTKWFNTLTDESLREFLHKQKIAEIEKSTLPFPLIDNGLDQLEQAVEMPGPEWSLVQDEYGMGDEHDFDQWQGQIIW